MHNGPSAKQSQNVRLMQHMRNRGSITSMMAFKRYAITRLAARIDDLERDGHLINSVWVQRNGKRYKAYSLVA